MREIKEIHTKEEQSLSANEALTLDARITLEGEEIFFLAWSEESDKPLLTARFSTAGANEGGMQQLFWNHPL